MNRIRYDELTAEIAARQPACGGTTVVAVDGPSGSGKTDLANELARVAGGAILHLDDIYPGWSGLSATPALVRGVLERIAVGDVGAVRRWDWFAAQDGPLLHVPPSDLLILDGVGSGSAVLRPYLSLLIWVDAPLPVRKHRALTRDAGVYEPFWDTWAAQESVHFAGEQTRLHADLVIDTGD